MKKKELIERLVSEIESGRVKTVGIYGHGASGKSYFAKELYQALDPQSVNLLETDTLPLIDIWWCRKKQQNRR